MFRMVSLAFTERPQKEDQGHAVIVNLATRDKSRRCP